jgi:hypothetical protein
MRKGVIMDHVAIELVEPDTPEASGKNIAMTLAGQINDSDEYLRVRYLFDADCAAAMITELIACAQRDDFGVQLNALIDQRIEHMRNEGSLPR